MVLHQFNLIEKEAKTGQILYTSSTDYYWLPKILYLSSASVKKSRVVNPIFIFIFLGSFPPHPEWHLSIPTLKSSSYDIFFCQTKQKIHETRHHHLIFTINQFQSWHSHSNDKYLFFQVDIQRVSCPKKTMEMVKRQLVGLLWGRG